MENLGLSLGYLLVQIIGLILIIGLPLGILFLAYRWFINLQQALNRIEERLKALDEHLEEVLDYLAEQEGER